MIDYNAIKLVIWDLDETFWKGILSEGPIEFIDENVTLVKDLTDRGIINSICSKNTFETTVVELEKRNLNDYFVFKSIDWTPKGQRIASLIKDMGLRPVNCLFIDDNEVNLNEAKFYSPDLMIAFPAEIQELRLFVNKTEPSDLAHNRLKQYHVLEKKQEAKNSATSNLEFLYSANTKVDIHKDCLAQIDRITELVNRTNQLNFTKVRSSKDELTELLSEKSVSSGYVTARDNFGDYGIVGFYAVKDNKCIHFLFSCRTIGQGVEQWVYSTIGCPELHIVGEVVNVVKKEAAPAWINQDLETESTKKGTVNGKILFKGPCDLDILTSFLDTGSVLTEFTYIGEKVHHSVEHHNHSINYLRFPFLNEKQKEDLLNEGIFNDEAMFDTSLYNEDVKLVFLSTLIEPNLCVYKSRKTGEKIAFGEWRFPLTDPDNWDGFVNQSYSTYGNHFTKDFLQNFSKTYEAIGQLAPADVFANIKELRTKLPSGTRLCLFLGSETPYLNNNMPSYEEREKYHIELNTLLRDFAMVNQNVSIIDSNKYIKGQEDFLDNINHFQRRVYYGASKDVNEIIEATLGYKLDAPSFFVKLMNNSAKLIGGLLDSESDLYFKLRKIYRTIRGGASK